MNPRNHIANWQAFAQRLVVGKLGFANPARSAPNVLVAAFCGTDHDSEFARYPVLNCRPAPPPGGSDIAKSPQFLGKIACGAGQVESFPFLSRGNNVDSWSIKTRARGLAVCVLPPFFWRQPPLWPSRAACKHPPAVRWAGPSWALSSRMRPTKTLSQGRPLVALRGLQVAAFRAFRPATTTDLTSAPFSGASITKDHPGHRLGWSFCISRHGRY